MPKPSIRLPHLKIAPSLLAAIEGSAIEDSKPPLAMEAAQQGSTPKVDVIIAIKADPDHPQDGIAGGKQRLLQELKALPGVKPSDSDFFLQCEATPDEVQAISKLPSVD